MQTAEVVVDEFEVTTDGGETIVGPVTLAQLRRGLIAGKVPADAQARRKDEPTWQPLVVILAAASASPTNETPATAARPSPLVTRRRSFAIKIAAVTFVAAAIIAATVGFSRREPDAARVKDDQVPPRTAVLRSYSLGAIIFRSKRIYWDNEGGRACIKQNERVGINYFKDLTKVAEREWPLRRMTRRTRSTLVGVGANRSSQINTNTRFAFSTTTTSNFKTLQKGASRDGTHELRLRQQSRCFVASRW
jgi:hypothetical protein